MSGDSASSMATPLAGRETLRHCMAGRPTNPQGISAHRRTLPGRSHGSVRIDTVRTRVECAGPRSATRTAGDRTTLACQAPCSCSGVEPACGAAIARSSSSQTRRAENTYPTARKPEPLNSRSVLRCSALCAVATGLSSNSTVSLRPGVRRRTRTERAAQNTRTPGKWPFRGGLGQSDEACPRRS